MMTPQQVRSIYRMCADFAKRWPTTPSAELAIDLLREIGVTGDAATILAPLVANAIDGYRRGRTHATEVAAFDSPAPAVTEPTQPPRPIATTSPDQRRTAGALAPSRTPARAPRAAGAGPDPITARRQLLNDTIRLESGRAVLWGDATVADHRERIGNLNAKIDGITATVLKHEQAIIDIERTPGATCLRDVPGWGK